MTTRNRMTDRVAASNVPQEVTSRLDRLANELEQIDPRIALAIDKVSDKIASIEDQTDIQEHMEHRYKSPGLYHPTDTMVQIKKRLENPSIHNKVEKYIKDNHKGVIDIKSFKLLSGYLGSKKSINIEIEFTVGADEVSPSELTKSNLDWITAEGKNLFGSKIAVPLEVFGITE